jgi:hypothetical protein
MRLQAILFGNETLIDRRDVERDAFNRVFHEAGLPWKWDAGSYARLSRLSAGGDVLDTFIRTERPRWRNRDDMQHLLAAVKRRHAAVCREIAAETPASDKDMLAIAHAARKVGLRLCAVVPSGDTSPEPRLDIAAAPTHQSALTALNVPAAACLAIECTAEGFDAAANAGIVALDKLAISSPGASHEPAVIALLEDVHARAMTATPASRLLSMAMIA